MSEVTSARKRTARCLVALAVVVMGVAQSMPEALAKFISTASPTNVVTAHTLVAPTLSCSATLLPYRVHLTWAATSDSTTADRYAGNFLSDGYEIDSGTTLGGPYSLLATTARTATSYDDSPTLGIVYYVIRSTKQSWRSTNSNQVTSTLNIACA